MTDTVTDPIEAYIREDVWQGAPDFACTAQPCRFSSPERWRTVEHVQRVHLLPLVHPADDADAEEAEAETPTDPSPRPRTRTAPAPAPSAEAEASEE